MVSVTELGVASGNLLSLNKVRFVQGCVLCADVEAAC